MKDWFDSFRQQLGDRMSSPIFGSFIIAWICWNHRYLILLFSSVPIPTRFDLINTLYPDARSLLLSVAILPVASSGAYLYLYPLISKPILVYWDKRQTELKTLRDEAQKKTLLTKEESQRIILESIELRKQFEEKLQSQAREIEVLHTSLKEGPEGKLKWATERITVLERELDNERRRAQPQDPLDNLSDGIRSGVMAILRILSSEPSMQISEDAIAEKLNVSRLKSKTYIDSALGAQLIEPTGSVYTYTLSALGRRYVLNNNLA